MRAKLLFTFVLFFGIASAQNPTANFSLSNDTICAGGCITCTDVSTQGAAPITAWSWTFPGATPSTSTVQNPSFICYSSSGTFTITLTVTDFDGRTDDTTRAITVEQCTGIAEQANDDPITIFPNPSNGIAAIQSSDKISSIEIVNVSGERIDAFSVNSAKAEIDVSNQRKGIYFIKVISKSRGLVMKKIILQ